MDEQTALELVSLQKDIEAYELEIQALVDKQSKLEERATLIKNDETFTCGILASVPWELHAPSNPLHITELSLHTRMTKELLKLFPGTWYHEHIQWNGLTLSMDDNDCWLSGEPEDVAAYALVFGLTVTGKVTEHIERCKATLKFLEELDNLFKPTEEQKP